MVVPMSEWLSLSLVLGGAVVSMALLLCACRRLSGTTLVAVCAWALVSVVSLAAVEVAIYLLRDGIARNLREALRWVATCSTFCPMMAQLGAKRPQDRGWQWIVLSLWVILSLPAVESLALSRSMQISTAWWAFAMLLVAIGVLNILPTRHWRSAIFAGMAQTVLLLAHRQGSIEPSAFCMYMLLAAIIAAFVCARNKRETATPLDRAWLDFRDMFGAVWALRIAEQLNKSSAMYGWGVSLRWHGLTNTESGKPAAALPAATEAAIVQSLRTLLRRFVSPAWLDARLPPIEHDVDET
jgi:hypothetical protein